MVEREPLPGGGLRTALTAGLRPWRWLGVAAIAVGMLLLFAAPALLRIGPAIPPLPVLLGVLLTTCFLLLAPDLPAVAVRPAVRRPAAVSLLRWAVSGGLLVACAVLWVLATRWTIMPAPDPTLGRLGALCWLASLGAFAAAVSVVYASAWRPRLPTREQLLQRDVLLVAALTLLTLMLRVVAVTEIPWPFIGDEGHFGAEGVAIAKNFPPELFASGWAGQTRMSYLAVATLVTLLGPDVLAVRLPPVLFGTATVPLLYLLGRRMFGPLVGLLAAALMATWYYAIHFSRLGHNFIGDAFFAVLMFWLLYRAVETEAPLDYLWAGVATGLTWYSYAGTRLLFFLALLFLAYTVMCQPRRLGARLPNLVIFGVMAALVAVPQLIYYKDRLDIFYQRLNQTGIVQTGWLAAESAGRGVAPLLIVLEQFLKTSWVYLAIPPMAAPWGWFPTGRPLLDLSLGLLLVLGLAWSLLRVFEPRHWLLQSWFWAVIVLGGALTLEPPTVSRIVMAAPAVCLFIALTLAIIVQAVGERGPAWERVGLAAVGAVLCVSAVQGILFYFGEFQARHYLRDAASELSQVVGMYARDRKVDSVYFLMEPKVPSFSPALQYFAPRVTWFNQGTPLTPDTVPERQAGSHVLYAAIPERVAELELVREQEGGGQWREWTSPAWPGVFWYSYELGEPRGEPPAR